MWFYCYIFIFRPWVTPFISLLKSRDSRLKILINEWSEIFDSNWALKPQRKRELRYARQVSSEIFKAKLNREWQCKHWSRSTQFWLVYALLRCKKTIWLAKGRNAYFIVETRLRAANEYSWVSKYVDSRFIRNLNSTHVQCVGNAHEARIRRTNTQAEVYVRFTRATNWSADDKDCQLYTLACLVNVYL